MFFLFVCPIIKLILYIYIYICLNRLHLKNNATGAESVLYLTTEQQKNSRYFHDEATGGELETISKVKFNPIQ
jgi:hypothetical protein